MKTLKNRRNYYRILQVQPDAAHDVIKASYRTLMQKLKFHPDLGGDDWNATVINEAYRVLCDRDRRAAYDAEQPAQMSGVGATKRSSRHSETASPSAQHADPVAEPPRAAAGFESMLCVLCHQLTNIPIALPGMRRCHACRSPLTRVDSVLIADAGKRALPRLERSAAVRYLRTHCDGAGRSTINSTAYQAVLENFSPRGMRLRTQQALDIGELLRIECQLLSAVARVVVSRAAENLPGHFIVGIEFITVDFAHKQGSLFERQA